MTTNTDYKVSFNRLWCYTHTAKGAS